MSDVDVLGCKNEQLQLQWSEDCEVIKLSSREARDFPKASRRVLPCGAPQRRYIG